MHADTVQVVRQLEQLFPGESEFLRNDLIFLLVLNGNDYLPKVSVYTTSTHSDAHAVVDMLVDLQPLLTSTRDKCSSSAVTNLLCTNPFWLQF
jgi:hypothetical protein